MNIQYKESEERLMYEAARKRVDKLKGFYVHLTVYVAVNAMILWLNLKNIRQAESIFEFNNFATAIYWGIGLLAHAVSVFGISGFFDKDWEERKIREIMDRNSRKDDFV
jgi:hypothetical protein